MRDETVKLIDFGFSTLSKTFINCSLSKSEIKCHLRYSQLYGSLTA